MGAGPGAGRGRRIRRGDPGDSLAAREAALRETGLHIVHAWLWPMYHVPLGGSPLAPPGAGLQAQAERVLATAESVAAEAAPGLVVESTLAVGQPATELLRRAGSQLVVVGNRGLGGFTGLLLAPPGSRCRHAHRAR